MNQAQRELLEQARQSVTAAKLLLEAGHAGYAAARAYYAMFYVASAFLEGEGLSFSSHSGVIAAFGQHLVKTGRVPAEFHHFLRRGHDLRLSGDYGPFGTISAEQAQEQIERAQRFLNLAAELLGST